jgi:hypothetical protein
MRPRARVQHDRGGLVGGGMQPPDQLMLGVGLAYLDLQRESIAGRLAQRDQIGIRGVAVDLGLPGTQPPQVRSVEHVHLHDETSW